jgi:predicted ABC-class ATPase
LRELERRIGRLSHSYKSYKDLRGRYRFEEFDLEFLSIQGDPFASPSIVAVTVPEDIASLPELLYQTAVRRTALEDFLLRGLWKACGRIPRGNRGTGKSGMISTCRPGQKVLRRTAVSISGGAVRALLMVGLPAAGRRPLPREAMAMFFEEIPDIVHDSLLYTSLDAGRAARHIETVEDADTLRHQLDEKGLAAFVADDSILPRESGVSDRPLEAAVAFASPDSLRVKLETPNSGTVPGMGVPKGITVIVGGGYHGKTTLLTAMQAGVYNHIPGDGRERVVTCADAVKIRAEDGRLIRGVDISPFITNLPTGQDTTSFSTENASGSTSQAAFIQESLELGANVLLIDEDTSATNFMYKDEVMMQLVPKGKEPITPFVSRVRALYDKHDVSTIVVASGSSAFLAVADTVIDMQDYLPRDVTARAHELAGSSTPLSLGAYGNLPGRLIPSRLIARQERKGRIKLRVSGTRLGFGNQEIDLSALEQIAEPNQTYGIGHALMCLERLLDGRKMREAIDALVERIGRDGPEKALSTRDPGVAVPRLLEIGGALNRLRD